MAVTFYCARYTRRLVELYQARVQAEYGESGSCFGHVCNWETRREDDKRITVKIFTPLKDACVMLPHVVTSTDQCLSQKITVFCLHFLSFCLAPSLAHSLASFIISLLSVNLAPCLPLCLSLFFPPYPPSPSLPPSHFPSLHVPLSIVVICPVANSASVCLSRLCWQWLLFLM